MHPLNPASPADELISVIIPVYNVEDYLGKCLRSVIRQSYPHLEIILVDDGSTDRSGELCDLYAVKDPRIRVIHTENRGLSAARNTGMKASTGSWISYIDPDDYIGKQFIERLHADGVRNHSDMVLCRIITLPADTVPTAASALRTSYPALIPENSVISGRDFVLKYLQSVPGVAVSAWSKLYARRVAEAVTFPEGKVYEDLATFQDFAALSDRISESRGARYYHLRERPGSITTEINMGNIRDYRWAILHSLERAGSLFPELREEVRLKRLWNEAAFWKMLAIDSSLDKAAKKNIMTQQRRKMFRNLFAYRQFPLFKQLQILMICFLPGPAEVILRFLKKHPDVMERLRSLFARRSG